MTEPAAYKVVQIAPAEPGWRALFGEYTEEQTRSRVVAWALVEEEGVLSVVGMVVDPMDPAAIVAAPDAATPEGTSFSRYGFVEK